ncbi:hypothetical protein Tco_0600569 [Tanacetum coccineum]
MLSNLFHRLRWCRSSKGKGIAGDQDSERSTPSPPITGSPGSIYQMGWDVPNNCRLDTPEACQDVVDHIAPPGDKIHHGKVKTSLKPLIGQCPTKNATWIVKKAQGMKLFTLEVHSEEAQPVTITDCHADNPCELRYDLTAKINLPMIEEWIWQRLIGAYNRPRVSARCAKIDARLDALSVDFDEELYSHMLTAIAGRRWVIGHDLRLAVMKCAESTELRQAFANVVSAGIAKGMSEGLKYGVEHGKAGLELTAVEAYDPEADNKYVAALHNLKDLSYPLIDELEQLKDAPLDVIMASLYLEIDTGEDAPQSIRDLRPSSSQLKIPVYPKKKKKSRVVCHTHGVSSAHHARSDGIPVSVPTVAPQGLQILLADAATQTEDEESLRLRRSKSLPPMFNLDWP